MISENEYFAFISYNHKDEKWASWLQRKLEHYKLPTRISSRTDLPKEIRPVFKDTSELRPGNLPQQIEKALFGSRFLIVICSPHSAKSEWVNKEIEVYAEQFGFEKVIPFIVDGQVKSENECYPEALKSLPDRQELLGANVDENGREAAFIKVVSRMFDLKFDVLWNRHERAIKRTRRLVLVAAIVLLSVVSFAALRFYKQRQNLYLSQSRFISAKANELISVGDSYLASLLLLDVLPGQGKPHRPYSVAAEAALRKSLKEESLIFEGSSGLIDYCVTNDEHYLVGLSSDSLRVWDISNGALVSAERLSVEVKSVIPANEQGFFLVGEHTNNSVLLKNRAFDKEPFSTFYESANQEGYIKDVLQNKITGDCAIVSGNYCFLEEGGHKESSTVVLLSSEGIRKDSIVFKDTFVGELSFNKDGSQLLIGDYPNCYHYYRETGELYEHRAESFVFSEDGEYMLVQSDEKTSIIKDDVYLFSYYDALVLNEYQISGELGIAVFAPDGGNRIAIVDIARRTVINEFEVIAPRIASIDAENNLVIVITEDGSRYDYHINERVLKRVSESIEDFGPESYYEIKELQRSNNDAVFYVGGPTTVGKLDGAGLYAVPIDPITTIQSVERVCFIDNGKSVIFQPEYDSPLRRTSCLKKNDFAATFDSISETSDYRCWRQSPLSGELFCFDDDTCYTVDYVNDSLIIAATQALACENASFSQDGRYLVKQTDNTVEICSHDGKCIKKIKCKFSIYGGVPYIYEVSVSSDGKKLLMSCLELCNKGMEEYRYTVLWDVDKGTYEEFPFAEEVSFTPDEKSLVALEKNRICFYSLQTGKRSYYYTSINGRQIAFLKSGLILLADDTDICCIDKKGNQVYRVRLVTGPLAGTSDYMAMGLSPSGNTIIAISRYTVYVLDAQTGIEMDRYEYEGEVFDAFMLADENYVFIYGNLGYRIAPYYKLNTLQHFAKERLTGRELSVQERGRFFL